MRANRPAGVCADGYDDHKGNGNWYTTNNDNRNNHNLHCRHGKYLYARQDDCGPDQLRRGQLRPGHDHANCGWCRAHRHISAQTGSACARLLHGHGQHSDRGARDCSRLSENSSQTQSCFLPPGILPVRWEQMWFPDARLHSINRRRLRNPNLRY